MANPHNRKVCNFTTARNGGAATIGRIFPDGVIATFAHEDASMPL
jgi:hypothetical protein